MPVKQDVEELKDRNGDIWNPPSNLHGISPPTFQKTGKGTLQNHPTPHANHGSNIDKTIYQNWGHYGAEVNYSEKYCRSGHEDRTKLPINWNPQNIAHFEKHDQRSKHYTKRTTENAVSAHEIEAVPPPIPERTYKARLHPKSHKSSNKSGFSGNFYIELVVYL